VSDEEADESTEDGLICKRKRVAVIEPPAIGSVAPNFIEKPPPAPPHHSSPLGMFSFQTPQLLRSLLSNLLIRKPPPKPPRNSPPHHHASKLPPPSNLVRVVVSTNLRLLQQPQASQLLFKKP